MTESLESVTEIELSEDDYDIIADRLKKGTEALDLSPQICAVKYLLPSEFQDEKANVEIEKAIIEYSIEKQQLIKNDKLVSLEDLCHTKQLFNNYFIKYFKDLNFMEGKDRLNVLVKIINDSLETKPISCLRQSFDLIGRLNNDFDRFEQHYQFKWKYKTDDDDGELKININLFYEPIEKYANTHAFITLGSVWLSIFAHLGFILPSLYFGYKTKNAANNMKTHKLIMEVDVSKYKNNDKLLNLYNSLIDYCRD